MQTLDRKRYGDRVLIIGEGEKAPRNYVEVDARKMGEFLELHARLGFIRSIIESGPENVCRQLMSWDPADSCNIFETLDDIEKRMGRLQQEILDDIEKI